MPKKKVSTETKLRHARRELKYLKERDQEMVWEIDRLKGENFLLKQNRGQLLEFMGVGMRALSQGMEAMTRIMREGHHAK